MSNNTNLQHKNYQPPSQRLAMVIRDTLEVGEKYRQSIEVMEYSQHEKILFDVNICGKQALQRAQILLRLLRTQKGFEQQWKHTISLSAPTGVRDLHFATGSQYRERVMFSINASVADYINVSTPSIIFLFTFPTKKVHSMSNNLGIDIDNVVNVQLLKEQRGANYDNINHVIMMTSETGAIFDGKTIYATYKKIAGVKADFGITSKTYQMATAFFGTSPNPIGSGGSLIIGHLRKSDLTLPAVEFDTLTGSEIDSNALVKALRQIEDGSMKLGELTLENLHFGDAVTFNDVINTLNRALPDGYPSAENQPNDNNVPTTGKSTFTHHDKRLVVSGKGLTNASPTGTGTFIGNLLGLGDSATLTKATPSQTLPAQSPDEAIADVVAASSGCGYCFIDELTNDQILKLAN